MFRTIMFWVIFVFCAVWLQFFLPGVDFLAAGIVISLQREERLRTVWLALVFILLQEGMGSVAFGKTLFTYGVLAGAFFLGQQVFESRSVLFMFLLGLTLGLLHVGVGLMLSGLQDVTLQAGRLAVEGIWQTLVFPVQWAVADRLHDSFVPRHVNSL